MEDFFKQLMAALCGGHPQGLLFGALILLVAQRLGLSNIKLPSLPIGPQPTPSPLPILVPNPDGSPRFPKIRKLLELLMAGGNLMLQDLPAAELKAIRGEIDAVIAEKAEKVRGELKELE